MKKRKISRCLVIAMLLVTMVLGVVPETVSAAAKTTGWKKESTGWCYYENGTKVRNKLKKIGGKYYYLGSNGARKTGWYTVSSKNKGKVTYKAMQFANNGAWTGKSTAVDTKMIQKTDSLIKGLKISTALTTTAQKEAALQKIFNYTKKYKYGRVTGLNSNSFNRAKVSSSAYAMMSKKKGNCYYYASAFATLAKRATGLPVRVCCGKSNVFNKSRWSDHAWVEIKIGNTWYVYDVNAAAYSTRKDIKFYKQNAKASYKAQKNIELYL